MAKSDDEICLIRYNGKTCERRVSSIVSAFQSLCRDRFWQHNVARSAASRPLFCELPDSHPTKTKTVHIMWVMTNIAMENGYL